MTRTAAVEERRRNVTRTSILLSGVGQALRCAREMESAMFRGVTRVLTALPSDAPLRELLGSTADARMVDGRATAGDPMIAPTGPAMNADDVRELEPDCDRQFGTSHQCSRNHSVVDDVFA